MNIDTTKPVDRTGNIYCGPLVVAAILGTSTGNIAAEVARMRVANGGAVTTTGKVRRVRARTAEAIRGTHTGELEALLTRAGFSLVPVDVGARYHAHPKGRRGNGYVSSDGKRWLCTQFLADGSRWLPWTLLEHRALPLWQAALRLRDGGTYIVHLPGHWAIASDGKWCETHTQGQWVPLAAAPRGNRKVRAAWRVTRS